jgi:hypothetical protein
LWLLTDLEFIKISSDLRTALTAVTHPAEEQLLEEVQIIIIIIIIIIKEDVYVETCVCNYLLKQT